MSEPIRDTETAVRELGALPVPVGTAALTAEQRAAIAELIGDAKPATGGLLEQLAESVRDLREHEHPTWEDLFCLNLVSWAGERMGTVLRRLLDTEARVTELEAELYTEQVQHRTTLEQRNAHARELLELRPKYVEAVATVAALVVQRGERMKVENTLRDQVAELGENLRAVNAGWGVARDRVAELEARVAELEAEAAGQRRAGYQVAIDVMRQEKLPMSVGLLEAQLELEAFDHPKPHERPAGAYPPALQWAALLDADDLEGFLEDLVAAASGDDDLATLTEVESAIARWRAIGEAQHAHNTAPGPDADE